MEWWARVSASAIRKGTPKQRWCKITQVSTLLNLRSVQNPGWLFDIGDYPTQVYGDNLWQANIRIPKTQSGFQWNDSQGFGSRCSSPRGFQVVVGQLGGWGMNWWVWAKGTVEPQRIASHFCFNQLLWQNIPSFHLLLAYGQFCLGVWNPTWSLLASLFGSFKHHSFSPLHRDFFQRDCPITNTNEKYICIYIPWASTTIRNNVFSPISMIKTKTP